MPDQNNDMVTLAEKMDMLAEGFDDMVTADAAVYLAGLKLQELPETERMAHILDSIKLLARTAGCEIERGRSKEMVDA